MYEVDLMEESSLWRSREVTYISGKWAQIRECIPEFELGEFKEGPEELNNPYYQSVVRLPLRATEKRIPVGIVSNSYTLAQHKKVAELCMKSILTYDVTENELRCELGLTVLGEWMNFRVYFPQKYNFNAADGHSVNLRLECFNSVDGSCRLVIMLGWFRFICTNGMVIGETISELRDLHNVHMDVSRIESAVSHAMLQVENDMDQMGKWQNTQINDEHLIEWVDSTLAEKWGKFAAFRTFHICKSGYDAEYRDPFEKEKPSVKSRVLLEPVPGAPEKATNLYDIGQALSWVATNRNNAEEITKWQTQIPKLLETLASRAA